VGSGGWLNNQDLGIVLFLKRFEYVSPLADRHIALYDSVTYAIQSKFLG
jgi:hypothetical protein